MLVCEVEEKKEDISRVSSRERERVKGRRIMMGTDAERCWVRCLDVASSMRDSAVNGGIELEVEVLDELKVVIEAGLGTYFLRNVLEVWMVAVRNAPVPSGFRPEGSIMGFVKDLEAVRKIVRIGATNIYQWQGKVGSHVDFARRFRLYAGSVCATARDSCDIIFARDRG